jgi:hypothetical protein
MCRDPNFVQLGSVGARCAVCAVAGQCDVARVEPKAAGPAHPVCRVAQDICGEIDDSPAARALRVQVARRRRLVHDVVRRQAAVEVDVAEHAGGRKTVERPVHGGAMHAGIARGYLVEHLLG